VKRFEKRVKISVTLEVGSLKERLPVNIETTLYRIIQEALTNVARHAQATHVHLELRRRGSSVVAHIRDDGCGFDMAQVLDQDTSTSGTGLLGMKERTVLLGGIFKIHSEPGAGTQISIEIPMGNIS